MGLGDHSGDIVPRRIPAQNIVQRLLHRELNAGRRRGCNAAATARKFFTNIFPNFTVVNVEKPACFLRKFSPDGRHLIAFSADQTSLEIYEFCGPASAADMLNMLPPNDAATDFLSDNVDTLAAIHVRSQLFSRFFRLKRVTGIAVSGESLNRECSLFTSDGRSVCIKCKNDLFYFMSDSSLFHFMFDESIYMPMLKIILWPVL